MSHSTPHYRFDPADPVAPTTEEWGALSEAERAAVVGALPIIVEHDFMSEGDAHARITLEAAEMIRNHFGSRGGGPRRHYIGKSIMTWYPGERGFAPDLFVVFDVDDHERDSWVASTEGRRLDIAFEVLVKGDRTKDPERNVSWYARLGIPEYFVLDGANRRVHGFRLTASSPGGRYERIVPQLGRLWSEVLRLDIATEGRGFRFYTGEARVPTSEEVGQRLVDLAMDEARERAAAELARAELEAERSALVDRLAALEAQVASLLSQ
ncbi:MAG: Uma2 family endonuclease [Myxococcales bacterium]|nr:Uma2 family endonuclease [Myxococcales bacterium]